jgi:phage terminase large subunit GpA-like protein
MGETWEVKRSKSTPERVGDRLRTELPRGVVPEWGRLVTVTIDQQAAEGGYRLFVVMAHGSQGQSHVVDFGLMPTLQVIWDQKIRGTYQHADGGNPVSPHAAAADSGWDTKATYDFCNQHAGMLPIKGAATDLGGRPYKLNEVESGEHAGQLLLTVATDFWETDLQARLDERLPGEPESLSLCKEASFDFEFLDQLCNATIADKVDSRGNAKLLWVKKDDNAANDFRDAIRYGLALARVYVDENQGLPVRSATVTKSKAVIHAGDARPDGRAWNE